MGKRVCNGRMTFNCSDCGKEISASTTFKAKKLYVYNGKKLCFDCLTKLKFRKQRERERLQHGERFFCKSCGCRILKSLVEKYDGYCSYCFTTLQSYPELKKVKKCE